MSNSKGLLPEIVFIRPLLIVMLIMYHSFIIYQGGWSEPTGYVPCRAYWWISKLNYSFMLEAFVFISGYIFMYQLQKYPHRYESLIGIAKDKCKRLILPSIIFSAIYFALFYNYESIVNTTYTIVNGAGHMWYLPMLFWCFIGGWILIRCKFRKAYIIVVLALMAIVSYVPIPLRINSAMYYLLYFYIGTIVCEQRERIAREATGNNIVICWILFTVTFIGLTLFDSNLESWSSDSGLIQRAIFTSISKASRIVYATLGIAATYLTFSHISQRHTVSRWLIGFGNISMGVYILQQFILQALYYKTSLPEMVGSYWLPWIGAFITLTLSILGAYALKKCPVTKHLV